MFNIPNIAFNNHPTGPQNITLVSGAYRLGIPQAAYWMVRRQLLTNFLCVEKQGKIYCPCTSGISSNYPPFILQTGNSSFEIKPTAYLIEQDEICMATIVGISQPYW